MTPTSWKILWESSVVLTLATGIGVWIVLPFALAIGTDIKRYSLMLITKISSAFIAIAILIISLGALID